MYDWWCNVNKPCNCEEPVCTTDANTEVTTCADPVCSKTTDEECRIINRNAADGLHSAKCCNWNATGGPDINGDGTPDGFCWFDNSTVEKGYCKNAKLDMTGNGLFWGQNMAPSPPSSSED